jgi:HD-like signal output (HDOD) protein
MEEIQPIPQVALKILRLINEEEHDIKELTEEIRQDQVICAKTLKFCNSAVFGGLKKIDIARPCPGVLRFSKSRQIGYFDLDG